MQRTTERQRFEFIHLMMKHAAISPATVTADSPNVITEGDIERIARKLLRFGATYGRIQEFACNVSSEWQDAYYNKTMVPKEARIEKTVTDLLASIGCKPVFGGDPRGNTIKVIVPDGYTDDWGKEGICVPTS